MSLDIDQQAMAVPAEKQHSGQNMANRENVNELGWDLSEKEMRQEEVEQTAPSEQLMLRTDIIKCVLGKTILVVQESFSYFQAFLMMG